MLTNNSIVYFFLDQSETTRRINRKKKIKKLKYRLLQLGKLLAITLLTSKLDVTQCQWLSMLVFSPEVIVIVVMIKLLQGEISHYEGGAT